MMEVDVGRLLDQVAVFMEPECEKLGVTIDREYSGDMTAMGDKDLLYRAFYNLVANALQAMDGGGQVSIRAAREEGRLHVTVQDTGPGFSPEHINQVRDPFFTTKDEGTGLGLALVSTILESHASPWTSPTRKTAAPAWTSSSHNSRQRGSKQCQKRGYRPSTRSSSGTSSSSSAELRAA